MRGLEEDVPKALAKVNGKPIIWHIMNHYSQYGHTEFILPLGYKGKQIKEYFMSYPWQEKDITIHLGERRYNQLEETEPWTVTCVDTGESTMTGSRIKMVESYLEKDETFFVTYGDGLSDINLNHLLTFHKEKGKLVTLTGIKKENQYGVLSVEEGLANDFSEKPMQDDLINGGFFVCQKDFFNYLSKQPPTCVLEEEPLKKLIKDTQLAVYEHDSYWLSIDTPKDLELANKHWSNR